MEVYTSHHNRKDRVAILLQLAPQKSKIIPSRTLPPCPSQYTYIPFSPAILAGQYKFWGKRVSARARAMRTPQGHTLKESNATPPLHIGVDHNVTLAGPERSQLTARRTVCKQKVCSRLFTLEKKRLKGNKKSVANYSHWRRRD